MGLNKKIILINSKNQENCDEGDFKNSDLAWKDKDTTQEKGISDGGKKFPYNFQENACILFSISQIGLKHNRLDFLFSKISLNFAPYFPKFC